MEKRFKIKFLPSETIVISDGKESLLESARKAGIRINSPCGGKGTCRKCIVEIREGAVSGEPENKKTDRYVSCRTYPRSDMILTVPKAEEKHNTIAGRIMPEKRPFSGTAGVALDIGTTTVEAYLVDLKNKKIIASASEYNKQSVYGDDVITRIDHAKDRGPEALNRLIVETINGLFDEMLHETKNASIGDVYAAGNTAMTYLLLDKNPGVIKKHTELDEYKKPFTADARALGIRAKGKLSTLPGISGYVGGDVVGDILESGMNSSAKISMLIDIGTNGEIVLGNRDFLVACSTSAGPAFEGHATGCGMKASAGAIYETSVRKDFTVEYSTICDARPKGMCGSGLIDIVSELFTKGLIDHMGHFTGGRERFVVVPKKDSGTGEDIRITEKDIHNIILSKAALYAGAATMTRIGKEFEELERIYIAGGFGHHLDVEKAITIGLLPDLPKKKYMLIGNGSLQGAFRCLITAGKRKEAREIALKTTYYDLASEKTFSEEYLKALYLPHQDPALFPSVEDRT